MSERSDDKGEAAGRVLLDELSSAALAETLDAGAKVIVLLPVGSVEPHGPHLPLGTDTLISQVAARRASERMAARFRMLIAPAIPYGVTRCAEGFAGAISVAEDALSGYLRAVVTGFLADPRVAHVCVVNNHLEPEHDATVRRAIEGLDQERASVASPLRRKWARTLSEEFKRGECHAERYETSIMLAAAPSLVAEEVSRGLPDVPISLSEKLREGVTRFTAMGLTRAYAGAPAEASAAEGEALIERLAEMIEGEVLEAMGGG